MPARPAAAVSCHVERPLDNRAWSRFSHLQASRPGGLAIAALMRPPDRGAGEDAGRWLVRARAAGARGPFGLHTHWTSPSHARPTGGKVRPAERVARELEWLRERGLEPTLFAGGGWYVDEGVVETLAAAGLADCTATACPRGSSCEAARGCSSSRRRTRSGCSPARSSGRSTRRSSTRTSTTRT